MDCNPPPDGLRMLTRMIKLKSSDGATFPVEVKVAKMSLLIRNMLDDLGVDETEVIPMPQNAPEISGTILGKILEWADHHKDDPAAADDDDEKVVKPTDDISSWDVEFLQVHPTTLFQLIRAANFLNIKGLLGVTCKKVANMIKKMTIEEVRQRFNIQNDFSPEEEEQVGKENGWWDVFDSGMDDGKAVDGSVSDKTPADSVQEMDHEGGEIIESCLENAVVVRKILQHFANPELLKLSTMNKMWSYEARLMLRHRGDLVASLSCHQTRPCHEVFAAFGADLQQMNVVPYSGMNIMIHPKSHPVGSEALDPTYEIIRTRLALKHFSITLAGKWWDCKDCPGFILLKKLLQDFSGVIEELKLDIRGREEFVELFVRDCSFSELKVLKLQDDDDTFEESYTNYMRALVKRMPKLQELHTSGTVNLKENVLEGTEAVLMHQHDLLSSMSSRTISAPFDEISEDVVVTLRLKDVELLYTGPEFNLDLFNRMAPMLLQASCTTLSGIRVDGVLIVPLMCFGICLENVTDLVICLNYNLSERFQSQLLMLMKKFDFTRIFPNLEKVRIYYSFEYVQPSPDHMLAILEQAFAVLRDPLPNRAANIKELDLYQKYIPGSAAQFFAEMFPDIQKLVITDDGEGDIPFGSIWKHWPLLKEVEVDGKFLKNSQNLDSIFCGIFPEEIAQLREMDDEYLKSVNIVPVMPAITSLKNLKTFSVKLSCDDHSAEPFVDDGAFMFSKVTGLIAFARCPSRFVNLEFSAYGVLPVSHLEPFASVKCVDRCQMMAKYYAMDFSGMTDELQELQNCFGADSETD